MACEDDANSRFATRFKHLEHAAGDLATVGNLLHDPNLHVINDQRQ